MIAIRNAVAEDAAMLRLLAEKIWWPTYSDILSKEQIRFMLDEIYAEEKLRQQIENGEQTFLLLQEDEKTVAFAAYGAQTENPEIYKLHKLYALPKTQGKGYGKLLIKTVCGKVQEAGKHFLKLNVHRQNKTRFFYEKLGFKIIETVDIPFGPYILQDYIMQKDCSTEL